MALSLPPFCRFSRETLLWQGLVHGQELERRAPKGPNSWPAAQSPCGFQSLF